MIRISLGRVQGLVAEGFGEADDGIATTALYYQIDVTSEARQSQRLQRESSDHRITKVQPLQLARERHQHFVESLVKRLAPV